MWRSWLVGWLVGWLIGWLVLGALFPCMSSLPSPNGIQSGAKANWLSSHVSKPYSLEVLMACHEHVSLGSSMHAPHVKTAVHATQIFALATEARSETARQRSCSRLWLPPPLVLALALP